MSEGRGGKWIKIGGLALGLLLLVALISAMTDTGNLGTPDESRRQRHAAGFSIVVPASWGATPYFARGNRSPDMINMSPEKVSGRETSLTVARLPAKPADAQDGTPFTFQNKPAWLQPFDTKHDYGCVLRFERDGVWYEMRFVSPVPLDWQTSSLMRFAETFHTEAPTTRIGSLVTTMPVMVEPE